MRNVAINLSYDGRFYHGWQIQKELPTISGTLTRAIESVVGHSVVITGCGRTDAGVHAKTYTANFKTSSSIPCERLPYAVNTLLPDDIAVYGAYEVPEEFHSVFSCLKKEYTYYIYPCKIRNPFYNGRVYFYKSEPDIIVMKEAAGYLTGEHDFKAFRSLGSNVKTTVRKIYSLSVDREAELIAIRICANGFLYNMARTLAGTLLYVSEGKIEPTSIPEIINTGERKNAGPTLPPDGLYMTGVWYDNNE